MSIKFSTQIINGNAFAIDIEKAYFDFDIEQEELHKIRKSENLSHNKYRSSSEVEIARARRSLHIKEQKETEQVYAQRVNNRSQKVCIL
jgi:hypothetical protein